MLSKQPPPLQVRDVQLLVDDPAKIGVETGEDESSQVLAGLDGIDAEAPSTRC